MTTFNEYQRETDSTAVYPDAGMGTVEAVTYTTLGINGEAGEVAEQVKKMLRDNDGNLTPDREAKIKKELGDVLWYVARTCTELDFEMDEVAVENLQKLQERQRNHALHGEGSAR
jgi:NTP pyrophosphatase (non-canonical NTP hydrolase)